MTLHGEAYCTGLVSRQLLWCGSHSRFNLTFAVLGKSWSGLFSTKASLSGGTVPSPPTSCLFHSKN